MSFTRYRFQFVVWIKAVVSTKGVSCIFSIAGGHYLLYEISESFLRTTEVPYYLDEYWWFGFVLGVIYAFWVCKPRTSISHDLKGRDVKLEIAIGDVLSTSGDLVVGCNTTFDTEVSNKLISKNSVQGQFLKAYYANDHERLDNDIREQLRDLSAENLSGKRVGKSKKYKLGTVVHVHPDHQDSDRRAYLLAIADINAEGVAKGDFEGLKRALAELWVYVGERGSIAPLVSPVLGTGFSRVSAKREEVVREMFRSFVAACSERVFTGKFTVMLSWQDIADHEISIEDLGLFIRHICQYADHSSTYDDPIGVPI